MAGAVLDADTMPETPAHATHIDVDRVRITGAPAGTNAVDLRRALRSGLERELANLEPSGSGARSVYIPRLQLRLPAHATESDIAAALARAIAASRGSDTMSPTDRPGSGATGGDALRGIGKE